MQKPIFFQLLPSVITKRILVQVNLLIIILVSLTIFFNVYNRYTDYKKETQREIYNVADLIYQRYQKSSVIFPKQEGNELEAAQVMSLNNQLQPIINEIAQTYQNIGMGLYALDLDSIVAIHPYDPQKITRISHDVYPYFKIFETGQELYGVNGTSFGWDEKPILYYARPIKEDGVIIGHVWVNAKMEDIYERVYEPTIKCIVFWLTVLILCYFYVNRIIKNTKEALESFSDAAVTKDLGNENSFPELNSLVISYQKKEEELERLNQQLSNTLERISDGFYSLDSGWRFTYINQEAAKMLALQGKDLINKVIWDELETPDLTFIYEKYLQAIETQKPVHYEIFSNLAGVWLDVSAYPSANGLSVYFRDITQEKNHKEELIRSEQRFSMAFNASPSGLFIFRWDDARFIAINASCARIIGYTKEEIIGKTPREIGILAEPEKLSEIKETLQNYGFYQNLEVKLVKKSGEIIMCQSKLQITEMHGEKFLIGVFDDITEQKNAEELFFKAFELSPDIMTIRNSSDWKFVDVNESFIKCFGYKKEEVLGKSALDLGLIDEETHSFMVTESKKHGFIKNLEFDAYGKEGERHRILYSCEEAEINGLNCLFSCAKDISENDQMKKEMQRLDMLHVLGEMASGIAHEIRNPLSVVRGFLQLMKEQKNVSPENINLMIEELDRANTIISEYLSLAKNKPMKLQAMNLNDVILKLCPLIQADAVNSDQEILLELQDVSAILLDEKEIRQLILNLVRNGLESMDPGGTLYLRTYSRGEKVVLEVQDEGCGIPQAIHDKLGQPFVTTKDNGTGLGLSICYNICARHHAQLDYQTGSEGTIFYVRFPKSENQ